VVGDSSTTAGLPPDRLAVSPIAPQPVRKSEAEESGEPASAAVANVDAMMPSPGETTTLALATNNRISTVSATRSALASPTQNPFAFALASFESLQRMLVGLFYNRAPKANPLQNGQNPDGYVIGNVSAVDPDGDPLSYQVTQDPLKGSVVVNNDGSYTYTPYFDLAANGGVDFFTVAVSDSGLRLFSRPGITQIPVRVTVDAAIGGIGDPNSVSSGQLLGSDFYNSTTHDFKVVNLGSTSVTLVGYRTDLYYAKDVAGLPQIGSTLLPGESLSFRLPNSRPTNSAYNGDYIYVYPQFESVVAEGVTPTRWVAALSGWGYWSGNLAGGWLLDSNGKVIKNSTSRVPDKQTDSRGEQYPPYGDTVQLLDPPNSSVTLKWSDLSGALNKNADVILNLCKGGNASCQVKMLQPLVETVKTAPTVSVDGSPTVLRNNTQVNQTFTISTTVKSTTSFGIDNSFSVKAGDLKATFFENEFTAGITGDWVKSKTYQVDKNVIVAPGKQVALLEGLPMKSTVVDLTINYGNNSKIVIKDMPLSIPDSQRGPSTVINETPIAGPFEEATESVNVPVKAAAPVDAAAAVLAGIGSNQIVAASVTRAAQTPRVAPTALQTALASIHRGLFGLFENHAPQATPLQIGENTGRLVTGSVGAVDPDGDRLTYQVALNPMHGSVAVNPDGNFVYTPDAELAANGGQDTFVVTVSDRSPRIFSRPGVTLVPVTVTVGGGDGIGISGQLTGMAMSPDGGRSYVTVADQNRVAVLDTVTGGVIGSVPAGAGPRGIAVAADGRAYVTNSADGTVTQIDTGTNSVLGNPIPVGMFPTGIAVNTAGTKIYVVNSGDNTVSVIDTMNYTSNVITVGNNPFGVAVGGNRAYVTNEFDDTVSVIDTDTNQVINTIAVGTAPTGVTVGGNRVVVNNSGSPDISGDGTVTLIDVDTLKVLGDPIQVGDLDLAATVNADGTRAYVTSAGKISTIDLQSGQLVGEPINTPGLPVEVAIVPDGRLFVADSMTGTVKPITLDTTATANFHSALPLLNSGLLKSASVYRIYNLTRTPLELTGNGGINPVEKDLPLLGTVIPPLGNLEISTASVESAPAVLTFSNPTGDTQWEAHLFTSSSASVPIKNIWGAVVKGEGDVTPNSALYGDTQDLVLLEPAGTKATLSPGAASTNTAIQALCEGEKASCQFLAKAPWTPGWAKSSDPASAGSLGIKFAQPLINGSKTNYTEIRTVSATNSTALGLYAQNKLSVNGIPFIASFTWNVKLSSKFAKETTNQAKYSIVAPPTSTVGLSMMVPVMRTTGDLTISFGNTTLTVPNFVFSVPDGDRSSVLEVTQSELTEIV
jgi:YVTN family beta-propeller protein